MKQGAEVVIILDGDCYPDKTGPQSLEAMALAHRNALLPQQVEMFQIVTDPPSRGTPYTKRTIEMPVAASLGFWTEIGDYCAVRQLAHESAPMTFKTEPISGKYFAMCGMNIAFYPELWSPWCNFIDVDRFDDIWMGWLWQKEAYRRGYCFNMNGPLIRHSRQSNVWANLKAETKYLKENETLWSNIAKNPSSCYKELRSLLPHEERCLTNR